MGTARVLNQIRFCNPTDKLHQGSFTDISNPDAHLSIYRIETLDETFPTQVFVSNQFGLEQDLNVLGPDVLAVPAQKLPHNPPTGLGHFKGYRVAGQPINIPVQLTDQFNVVGKPGSEVVVFDPVLLLNPARKNQNGVVTEMVNPEQHLVCYEITPESTTRTVEFANQLEEGELALFMSGLLCVPSSKQVVMPPPTPITCNGLPVTISGTAGNDILVGTFGADVIAGLGGNDTIKGQGGNDVICGGNGNDKIYGGSGKDKLYGEKGRDRIYGGSGKDKLYGGRGRDRLDGGPGRDFCNGGPGRDTAIRCEKKKSIP